MNQELGQALYRITTGCFALLAISLTGSLPSLAEQPYSGITTDPRKPPAKQNPQYYSEELKTAPELSFIPSYTGKGAILTSGLFYPRLQNGRCYHLRWLAKEDGVTVLNWYRAVLESNDWTIVDAQSNERSLCATHEKEGLTVFLVLQPPNHPGFNCGFLMRYLEIPPKIAGK